VSQVHKQYNICEHRKWTLRGGKQTFDSCIDLFDCLWLMAEEQYKGLAVVLCTVAILCSSCSPVYSGNTALQTRMKIRDVNVLFVRKNGEDVLLEVALILHQNNFVVSMQSN